MKKQKMQGCYWWKRALFLSGVSGILMSPLMAMDPAAAEAVL